MDPLLLDCTPTPYDSTLVGASLPPLGPAIRASHIMCAGSAVCLECMFRTIWQAESRPTVTRASAYSRAAASSSPPGGGDGDDDDGGDFDWPVDFVRGGPAHQVTRFEHAYTFRVIGIEHPEDALTDPIFWVQATEYTDADVEASSGTAAAAAAAATAASASKVFGFVAASSVLADALYLGRRFLDFYYAPAQVFVAEQLTTTVGCAFLPRIQRLLGTGDGLRGSSSLDDDTSPYNMRVLRALAPFTRLLPFTPRESAYGPIRLRLLHQPPPLLLPPPPPEADAQAALARQLALPDTTVSQWLGHFGAPATIDDATGDVQLADDWCLVRFGRRDAVRLVGADRRVLATITMDHSILQGPFGDTVRVPLLGCAIATDSDFAFGHEAAGHIRRRWDDDEARARQQQGAPPANDDVPWQPAQVVAPDGEGYLWESGAELLVLSRAALYATVLQLRAADHTKRVLLLANTLAFGETQVRDVCLADVVAVADDVFYHRGAATPGLFPHGSSSSSYMDFTASGFPWPVIERWLGGGAVQQPQPQHVLWSRVMWHRAWLGGGHCSRATYRATYRTKHLQQSVPCCAAGLVLRLNTDVVNEAFDQESVMPNVMDMLTATGAYAHLPMTAAPARRLPLVELTTMPIGICPRPWAANVHDYGRAVCRLAEPDVYCPTPTAFARSGLTVDVNVVHCKLPRQLAARWELIYPSRTMGSLRTSDSLYMADIWFNWLLRADYSVLGGAKYTSVLDFLERENVLLGELSPYSSGRRRLLPASFPGDHGGDDDDDDDDDDDYIPPPEPVAAADDTDTDDDDDDDGAQGPEADDEDIPTPPPQATTPLPRAIVDSPHVRNLCADLARVFFRAAAAATGAAAAAAAAADISPDEVMRCPGAELTAFLAVTGERKCAACHEPFPPAAPSAALQPVLTPCAHLFCDLCVENLINWHIRAYPTALDAYAPELVERARPRFYPVLPPCPLCQRDLQLGHMYGFSTALAGGGGTSAADAPGRQPKYEALRHYLTTRRSNLPLLVVVPEADSIVRRTYRPPGTEATEQEGVGPVVGDVRVLLEEEGYDVACPALEECGDDGTDGRGTDDDDDEDAAAHGGGGRHRGLLAMWARVQVQLRRGAGRYALVLDQTDITTAGGAIPWPPELWRTRRLDVVFLSPPRRDARLLAGGGLALCGQSYSAAVERCVVELFDGFVPRDLVFLAYDDTPETQQSLACANVYSHCFRSAVDVCVPLHVPFPSSGAPPSSFP